MLFDPNAMSGASCNSLGAGVISIDVELPSQETIRLISPNAIPTGAAERKGGYSLGAGAISIDDGVPAVRKPYVLLVQTRFRQVLKSGNVVIP